MTHIQTRHYFARHLARYYLKGHYEIVLTFNRPGGVVAKYMLRLYKKTFTQRGSTILKKHREIEITEAFYRELGEFLPIEFTYARRVPVKSFVNALVTRQEVIDELLLTL